MNSNIIAQLKDNPIFQFHRAYWTFNRKECDELANKYPTLSPGKKLRLLHLFCIEIANSNLGQKLINEGELSDEGAWETGSKDTIVKIVRELNSKDSPFRKRNCLLWRGAPGESGQREPDLTGEMCNASFTHLGSLEVIRIDENENPIKIEFIPLDDIRGAMFANPSLYRAGKVFFDYDREDEIVLFPLIYGISWLSNNEFDHDGTMTRFIYHIDSDSGMNPGIGLGQQDYIIEDANEESTMFGISNVGEIMVGLELSDPKFDIKCAARGLDPDYVRNQLGKRQ